jgi:hypothetical protein
MHISFSTHCYNHQSFPHLRRGQANLGQPLHPQRYVALCALLCPSRGLLQSSVSASLHGTTAQSAVLFELDHAQVPKCSFSLCPESFSWRTVVLSLITSFQLRAIPFNMRSTTIVASWRNWYFSVLSPAQGGQPIQSIISVQINILLSPLFCYSL